MHPIHTRPAALRVVFIPATPRILAAFLGLLLLVAASPAPGGEEVPGRILLHLESDAAERMRAGRLDLPVPPGGERYAPRIEPLFVARSGELAAYAVLTFDAGSAAREGSSLGGNSPWLDSLRDLPAVLGAESDRLFHASALPDDPYFQGDDGLPAQFHLYNPGRLSIEAVRAWPFIPPGETVVVGVLDSGVDWEHPDLAERIWVNQAEIDGLPNVDDDGNGFVDDFRGWDWVDLVNDGIGSSDWDSRDDLADRDNDPRDYAGHGTQVSGFIHGVRDNGQGIAAHAADIRIMPLRIGWRTNAGGSVVYASYAAMAMEYAGLMGARVINCSWDSVDVLGLGAAVDAAINQADIVVVGSAGNSNTSSTSLQYIASRPDCIGVASVRENGSKSGFSNFGSWVDAASFGSGVVTTHFNHNTGAHEYRQVNGTSFAAPTVTGLAATLRAVNPSVDASVIRNTITSTLHGLESEDPVFHELIGGLVDMAAAVQDLGGGWDRSLWSGLFTPLGEGRVAYSATAGTGILSASTGQDLLEPAGDTPLKTPRAGKADDAQFLAMVEGENVVLRSLDGSTLDGWPQAFTAVNRLVVADLDGDGDDEVLVLAQEMLTVLTAEATVRWSRAFPGAHLVVGDFTADTPGLECAGALGDDTPPGGGGVWNGVISFLDANGAPVADWSDTAAAIGHVDAAMGLEFDASGDGWLVFLAQTRSKDDDVSHTLHAMRGGAERPGFPVELSLPPTLTLTGLGTGDGAYVLVSAGAANDRSSLRRVDALGDVRTLFLDGTLSGPPVAADVTSDWRSNVVFLLGDGTLLAADAELTTVTAVERNFPSGFVAPPVVADGDGVRFVVAADAAGRTWSVPLGEAGHPAPWPVPDGDAGGSRYLSHPRATPAGGTLALSWLAAEGSVCWTGGSPDWAGLRLRVNGGVPRVLPPATVGCQAVPSVAAPDILVLEALSRDGIWREVARVAVPAVIPGALTLRAAPNPFRSRATLSFDAVGEGAVLQVLDVRGRVVHTESIPQGATSGLWDGVDRSGRSAASGMYFLRLRDGDRSAVTRILKTP